MSKTILTYGVGFNSSRINTTQTHIYNIWHEMMRRCYCEKLHIRKPSYSNCSVDVIWHDYQNFYLWCLENYIEGFVLDKDILIKGNKIYGPNTCCFVPKEINGLFCLTNKLRGNLPIGVSVKGKKYRARFKKFGIEQTLGVFDTPEEAFNSYSKNKKLYIIELANKFKTQISEKTYIALINYEIEITD